ncbi:MAG: cyclic nucleotide-binding domain-containing protein [Solirubrobacteraceae bacterium]
MSAQPPTDPAFAPVLSASQLQEMAAFGSERAVAVGELLFEAGDASFDLFVVLEGEVQIVRPGGADGAGEAVVTTFGPGNFIGS